MTTERRKRLTDSLPQGVICLSYHLEKGGRNILPALA
jgi:hypothetical protein